MATKFKIIEIIKPAGEAIYETSKQMFNPGKGIINLSSQETIDYQFLQKNNNYFGGVVLPLSQITNSQTAGKYQLESCKGIQVEVTQDPAQNFSGIKESLGGRDALLDFVYIPLEQNIQSDSNALNAVKLGLLFQQLGKLVVFGVKVNDKKSVKDLQKSISSLVYYISTENLFLQGLIIEVDLLDIENQDERCLVNSIVLKRCLPSGVRNIGLRIRNQKDIQTIYLLNSRKNLKMNIIFSVNDSSIEPNLLTMASVGIFI